jgi:hypothetical protein
MLPWLSMKMYASVAVRQRICACSPPSASNTVFHGPSVETFTQNSKVMAPLSKYRWNPPVTSIPSPESSIPSTDHGLDHAFPPPNGLPVNPWTKLFPTPMIWLISAPS